jgi:hypothetical protein
MIPIGIVAVSGVVSKTVLSPTVSLTNFNAYTNNITVNVPVGMSATNYILESSSSSSGPWTIVYQGASSTYQHTGLIQDTAYFYRARYSNANNLFSYSSISNTVSTRQESAKTSIFTTSTNFVKPIGVTNISYLMIGAGGKGGNSYWNNVFGESRIAGGGGGAGQLITSQSYSVPEAQTTYPITAGVASNTTFLSQTAIKGGDGSSNNVGSNGSHGGGGGGTYTESGQTIWSPGSSTIGGYSGGVGFANGNQNIASGGGGGGTGSVGGNYNAVFYYAGSGGSGTTVSLNGNSYTVGSGGSGGASSYSNSGANQPNSTGYGNGGNAANAGNVGKGTTYTGGNGSTGAVIVSWLD